MDNIVRFLHGARQVRGEKYNQERRDIGAQTLNVVI